MSNPGNTTRGGAFLAAMLVGTTLALALAAGPAGAESKKEQELEDRVQRLEIMLKAVTDDLKKTKKEAKEAKTAATSAKIPAKVARSGKSGVTLTVSGQVDRGVLLVSDGEDTELFHVDNDHSSTRVRFVGKGQVNKDLEVGTNIEVQIESNSTGTVNMLNTKRANTGFTERKLELYAKHKKFGKLTLGQGPTASDSSSELDLTGTNLIVKSNQGEFAGGQIFVRKRSEQPGNPNAERRTTANPTIGGSFSNFDGLSRRDRARYDSPSFYGFTVSGSTASQGAYDGAVRYQGKFGSIKTVAAIAAANDPQGGNDRNQYSGSGSVLHEPTGLAFTAAMGCRDGFGKDRGCNDRRFWYVKGGWQWDIFDFGRSYFAVDYYKGKGIAQAGERSDSIGTGFVQKIDSVATELYAGVRNYSLQRSPKGGLNQDFDDIFAFLAGARIKF